MKKTAAASHHILVEVYSDDALAERTVKSNLQFKCGNFVLEDEERSRAPPKFEDEELEASLDEDSSQMQEELAKTFGVTQPAIS